MIPLAGGLLALDNTDTWVLFAFILFIALLVYFGVPSMLARSLDQRAANIRGQLEEARKLREEAQTKLAEFQRQQQQVQTKADEIVAAARRDAEQAAEDAKKAIADSVEKRLKSAEEQIEMAEADAVRRVRDEAVDAAIAASRTLLKQTIGQDDATAMMDKAISEVTTRVN
ncbi:MAG: ATP F0F1 synthase subunit B [Pseudomonadota bacterium]